MLVYSPARATRPPISASLRVSRAAGSHRVLSAEYDPRAQGLVSQRLAMKPVGRGIEMARAGEVDEPTMAIEAVAAAERERNVRRCTA